MSSAATLRDPRLTPADLGEVASRGSAFPYVAAAHHWRIAREFVEVAEGRNPLLCIAVGVQMGKSQLASVLGSTWYLGVHPERHVIVASYSTDFAASRIGRPARDLFERVGEELFGVAIDASSTARDSWNTAVGGGMYCAGVDRGIAGRRADLVCIDDPHSGMADASSATQRAQLWEWYGSELQTRKAPGAGEIVISSRWHTNDFLGTLVENAQNTGRRFKLLDMPALAICSVCGDYGVEAVNACGHGVRDDLGRLPGESLWPAVRGREFLLEQRRNIGTRAFLALYQCRPTAETGTVFQRPWIRYATLAGDVLSLEMPNGGTRMFPLSKAVIFSMVDLASSLRSTADYFVCATFAICGTDLVVLDIVRERATAQRQRELVNDVARKWRPAKIGVEAVAYQQTFVEFLAADGLPVKAIRPSADKVTRAQVAAARVECGQVFVVRGAFTETFVDELLAFPTGAHDDMTDCLSMAAEVFTEALQQHAPLVSYIAARNGVQIPMTDAAHGSRPRFVEQGADRIV